MDSQEPSVQAQPEPSAPAAAPSPSAATDCHGKKRKYEEATYDEKRELVLYATANPHLKQRELADWFHKTFDKAINQSTVSRNLKRFKNDVPASPSSTTTPAPLNARRRTIKPVPSITPPQRHTPPTTQFFSYIPKESSEAQHKHQDLDELLYSFYCTYRRRNVAATSSDITQALKAEAQKIVDATSAKDGPGPGSGSAGPDRISEEWVASWQRNHCVLPPSPSSSSSESSSPSSSEQLPRRGHTPGAADVSERIHQQRKASGPTEKHTGVVAHPPTPAAHISSRGLSPIAINMSDEKQRKREIRRLRKDIEKRDKQILKARNRKERSLQRLEELEKMDTSDGHRHPGPAHNGSTEAVASQ